MPNREHVSDALGDDARDVVLRGLGRRHHGAKSTGGVGEVDDLVAEPAGVGRNGCRVGLKPDVGS